MEDTVDDAVARVTDQFRQSREWGLMVAHVRLERGVRALDSQAHLTTADNRLLWLLATEGPRTMREIAEQLGLEQSTVNRQVNASLTRGLVERVERPGETARALRITSIGSDLFEAEFTRVLSAFGAGLDALPEAERKCFATHFLTFADAFLGAAKELTAERRAAAEDTELSRR